jgi:hypothetical protein
MGTFKLDYIDLHMYVMDTLFVVSFAHQLELVVFALPETKGLTLEEVDR